jgi:peptidoglycan/xylan/chitin deacetylase (PgdA/CDA1 family)
LTIGGRPRHWELEAAVAYSAEEFQKHRHWLAWDRPQIPRHTLFLSLYELLFPLAAPERTRIVDDLRNWAGMEAISRPSHRPLTLEQAQALAAGDLFEVGAHTVTHPCLSSQEANVQREEILQSKDCLEQFCGRPVTSFAYPYGRLRDYNGLTVSLLKKAGFGRACSNFAGMVGCSTDAFQLPRIPVPDWDGETFARNLAGWFQE